MALFLSFFLDMPETSTQNEATGDCFCGFGYRVFTTVAALSKTMALYFAPSLFNSEVDKGNHKQARQGKEAGTKN